MYGALYGLETERNEETASTAVYPQTDQSPYTILLLQSALQPLVGFGLLYDFVPQSIYHTRILTPWSRVLLEELTSKLCS